MFTKWVTLVILVMLCTGGACSAQENPPSDLILRVDQTVIGPVGGQKSLSCLRIYSDGKVFYASWWSGPMTMVDQTGAEYRPEHKVSVEHQLEKGDVFELSTLFQSKAIKRLPENFAPPHPPIDYFEKTTVQITLPKGTPKEISTREFYVADLEEKTRYPAALIVLMGKIDEIEKVASDKGKPAATPSDCQLNAYNH